MRPTLPIVTAGTVGPAAVALALLGLAAAGCGIGAVGAAPGNPVEAKGVFVPAGEQGEVTFALHPVETTLGGRPYRVSFGVPFPRGWLTDPHTLRVLAANRAELPIAVRLLSPWRDLGTLQMLPSARSLLVQADVTFADRNGDGRPDPVSLIAEWGRTRRDEGRDLRPAPVRDGWSLVADSEYPAQYRVMEPPAYAVFPPAWYGQCVLKSRLLPLGAHPDFATYDALFRLMGDTATNRVDPRVREANLQPYLTEFDPWLFDRASTLFQLAFRTGDFRRLRAAHRAAQFYADRITPKGYFGLKDGDVKYSYVECLATDYWLTGDPRLPDVADQVVAAWRDGFDIAYGAANLERHWTERHAGFKLLALTAAYELSGDDSVGRDAKAAFDALVRLQEAPIPGAPREPGALFHTALSHGDGDVNEIVASPWMSTLLADAVQRYYTHSGDARAPVFVRRMARFFQGPESLYWSTEYDRARRLYPFYLAQVDRKPRGDVWEDVEHPLDTAKLFALAYFYSRVEGQPDSGLLTSASDLIKTHNEATFPAWIRPAGIGEGLAPFRLGPPRKFSWWFRTTADLDWLVGADQPLHESQDADGVRIALTLSADRESAHPGETATYTLRYRNEGRTDAAAVVLRVPAFGFNTRADASLDGPLPGGTETTNDLLWSVGTLGAGQSGAVTFRLRLKPYPAFPSPRRPLTPLFVQGYYYCCKAGHSVFSGCQPITFEGGKGQYCHSGVSNPVVVERPSAGVLR